MPDLLNIVPSSVELKGGDSQAFEARDATGNPVAGVTWSMQDRNVGSIGADDGVYVAAARVYKTRRLAVLARKLQKGDDGKETVTAQGNAEIILDPSRSWVPFFGGLWIVLFVALVTGLLLFWTELCPQCSPPFTRNSKRRT